MTAGYAIELTTLDAPDALADLRRRFGTDLRYAVKVCDQALLDSLRQRLELVSDAGSVVDVWYILGPVPDDHKILLVHVVYGGVLLVCYVPEETERN